MNRRSFLKALAAIPVVAAFAPLVTQSRREATLIDLWLKHNYGPVIRERLGPRAHWMDYDGQILKFENGAYRAVVIAPKGDKYTWGQLAIYPSLLRGDDAAFVRAIDIEMRELISAMESWS